MYQVCVITGAINFDLGDFPNRAVDGIPSSYSTTSLCVRYCAQRPNVMEVLLCVELRMAPLEGWMDGWAFTKVLVSNLLRVVPATAGTYIHICHLRNDFILFAEAIIRKV